MSQEFANLEVPYQALTVSEDVGTDDNYLSTEFQWINNWLLYMPLWITTNPEHRARSPCVNRFMLFLVVIAIVVQYIGSLHPFILLRNTEDTFFNIYWDSMIFVTMLSRFLSLYYFYSHFNWPWYVHRGEHCHTNHAHKQNVTIRIMLFLAIGLDFSRLVLSAIGVSKSTLNLFPGCIQVQFLLIFTFRIIVFYPLILMVIVQCLLFVYYYSYLAQLTSRIETCTDQKELDLSAIFEQYEKLYKAFRFDYHPWLKWSVQCFMFAEVLFVWDAVEVGHLSQVFDEMTKRILDAATTIMVIVLYVWSSALITESYQKFERLLWSKGREYFISSVSTASNASLSENKMCYNYLLQYVQRYPLSVRIGSFCVTRWNIVKFFIVFSLSKVAAVGISSIVDSKT